MQKETITKKRKEELLLQHKLPETKEENEFLNRVKRKLKNLENPTDDDLKLIKIILEGVRKSELLEGATPETKEEEWLIRTKIQEQENIKKQEDQQKKDNLATQEAIALAKKYGYHDYLPGGKFNNSSFIEKENYVHEYIRDDFYKYLNKNHIVFQMEKEEVYLEMKIKALKNLYNIDWKPFGHIISDKFFEEYKQILKKYKLPYNVLNFVK